MENVSSYRIASWYHLFIDVREGTEKIGFPSGEYCTSGIIKMTGTHTIFAIVIPVTKR